MIPTKLLKNCLKKTLILENANREILLKKKHLSVACTEGTNPIQNYKKRLTKQQKINLLLPKQTLSQSSLTGAVTFQKEECSQVRYN
jgi:hypothetical protein